MASSTLLGAVAYATYRDIEFSVGDTARSRCKIHCKSGTREAGKTAIGEDSEVLIEHLLCCRVGLPASHSRLPTGASYVYRSGPRLRWLEYADLSRPLLSHDLSLGDHLPRVGQSPSFFELSPCVRFQYPL
jgi:hypothetical protein